MQNAPGVKRLTGASLIAYDTKAAISLLEKGVANAYLVISDNNTVDIAVEETARYLSDNPYVSEKKIHIEDDPILDAHHFKEFTYQLDRSGTYAYAYINGGTLSAQSLYTLQELKQHAGVSKLVTDTAVLGSCICEENPGFIVEEGKTLYWYEEPDAENRHFGKLSATLLRANREGSFKSYAIDPWGVLICQTSQNGLDVFVHCDFKIPDDEILRDILIYSSRAMGHIKYPCMPERYLPEAIETKSCPATPTKRLMVWYSYAGLDVSAASLEANFEATPSQKAKVFAVNAINSIVDVAIGIHTPFAQRENSVVYRTGLDEYERYATTPPEEFRTQVEYFVVKNKSGIPLTYIAILLARIRNTLNMLVYIDRLKLPEDCYSVVQGLYALADQLGDVAYIISNVQLYEGAQLLTGPPYKIYLFLDETGKREIYYV